VCHLKLSYPDPNKDFVCFGEANCVPTDNFCRATGRKLALTRALKQADFDYDARKAIWAAYWGISNGTV
jgi:hypothetical protein